MNLKLTALSFAAVSASSFALLLHAAPPNGRLQVDITAPADRSRRPWGSQVPYAVTASYDGKSTKFGELPGNDVVVRATYVPDTSAQAARSSTPLPEALIQMSQSNCTGCHDFTAAAAGPSFSAIGQRYKGKGGAAATLAAHIRNGSRGDWGAGTMPPHPDVQSQQAAAIARWIIGYGNDPAVHYSVGESGSFRMISIGKAAPHAGIALSAFYTGPLKPGDTRTPAGRNVVIVDGSGS